MIPARVLVRREETRLAVTVTGLAVALLVFSLVDDLAGLRIQPLPLGAAYYVLASLMMLAAVGPWLAWTRRGEVSELHIEEGRVVSGPVDLRRSDVTGLLVAEGLRGASVAVARGPEVMFIEVSAAADAKRIARALGAEVPPHGTVPLRKPSRVAAFLQLALSGLALACGPLYATAALSHSDSAEKAFFGVSGIALSVIGLGLLAARHALAAESVSLRRGAYDAHVTLHLAERAAAVDDPARDAERATEEPERRLRVAPLARRDEPVGSWLARIDAMPDAGHAYRSDAMGEELLAETLADASAPLDERMAAGRLLARRHGATREALVRVVTDEDERARVEAAMEEEQVDAERRLAKLGPLFRAR